MGQTEKETRRLINLDRHGVAIQGYDPVAYFTVNQATKGKESIQFVHDKAIYYFATESHRERFAREPQKYIPQFGGYCAWAVSKNELAKIDPKAFQIVDGKLLLQYNLSIRDRFSKDTPGNYKKAVEFWPGLVEKKGKLPE